MVPDGPDADDMIFTWKDQRIPGSPRIWRIPKALWGKPNGDSFGDLGESAWDDDASVAR